MQRMLIDSSQLTNGWPLVVESAHWAMFEAVAQVLDQAEQAAGRSALSNWQEHPEVIVLNRAGDETGIEVTRQLGGWLAYPPRYLPRRYVVWLGAHQLTNEAQHALLKTIEDCPSHTQFVLACQHADDLLPTILSRCVRISMPNTENPQLAEQLTTGQNLYQQLTTVSLTQLSTMTKSYSDRPAALVALESLLVYLHRLPSQPATVYAMSLTAQAYELLQKNVNLRLTLECLFFAIRRFQGTTETLTPSLLNRSLI